MRALAAALNKAIVNNIIPSVKQGHDLFMVFIGSLGSPPGEKNEERLRKLEYNTDSTKFGYMTQGVLSFTPSVPLAHTLYYFTFGSNMMGEAPNSNIPTPSLPISQAI